MYLFKLQYVFVPATRFPWSAFNWRQPSQSRRISTWMSPPTRRVPQSIFNCTVMTSWLPSLFQAETVLIAKFYGSRSRSDSTATSSTWMSPDNPINQNPILVYNTRKSVSVSSLVHPGHKIGCLPSETTSFTQGRTNMFPWCPFRCWDDSGSDSTRVSQSQHFIRLFFFLGPIFWIS